MLCFSLVVSGASALAYLLDTHGANGAHIFALTDVARAATHYSSTFFANGRVRAAGVERALLVLGACQAACALAAVPMYVCGKRVRSFVSTSQSCACLGRFFVVVGVPRTADLTAYTHRSCAILACSVETSRHPPFPNLHPWFASRPGLAGLHPRDWVEVEMEALAESRGNLSLLTRWRTPLRRRTSEYCYVLCAF